MYFKKSQSAMEYLMTYGWAILIIAVVLGILFQLGIFSGGNFQPHAQAGSCQVQKSIAGISLEGECNGMLPEFVGQFNGASSVITTSMPSTATPSQGTIVIWFNRQWTTNDGQYHGLVGMGGYYGAAGVGNTNDNSIQLFKWTDNKWYFGLWSPSGGCWINSVADSSISGNTWHQLTVEWGGSINGAEMWFDDGTPSSCPPTAALTAFAVQTIYIGESDTNSYMNGYLANLQIYNTTLSASEVQALYQEGIGGAPIRPQNLVGWWPLNGNANDYSGNNNNGNAISVGYSSSWESGYTAP